MVARWMQAKVAKQKKMRRAWAKPYSMKRTGMVASPGFRNDQGEWVDMSPGSRTRAGAGVKPHQGSFLAIKERKTAIEREPWLNTKFMSKNPFFKFDKDGNSIPNEQGIYARVHGNGANPRALVLCRQIQSTNGAGSLQGEEILACQKLLDGPFEKLAIYIGRDIAFFFELRKVGTKEVLRRSINYTGKRRAMDAYCNGNIAWVEVFGALPQQNPPVPSG